jgi:hypothetical protein
VQLVLHGSSDVKFRLGTASTAAFTALLAEMDARLGELGVLHYGLSMTTLEEVSAAGNSGWCGYSGLAPRHGHRLAPVTRMRICRRLELRVRIYL